MEDNIRTAQNFKAMTTEEIADTRKRAITGSGVYTGPTLEYWKKKSEQKRRAGTYTRDAPMFGVRRRDCPFESY